MNNYDSARYSDLNAAWTTSDISPTQLLRKALRVVRARSREQYRNSSVARAAVQNDLINVLGHKGIALQSAVVSGARHEPDNYAREIIEKAYKSWIKQINFTGSATQGGLSYEKLARQTYLIDGELFERRHRAGDYGVQYEIVDATLIRIEHNDQTPNGNVIIMGIEYNAQMRPVAYHIDRGSVYSDGYSWVGSAQCYVERVDAADMLHTYDQEFPGQLRGVPAAATSLELIRMLQQVQKYTLAKLKSSSMTYGHFEKLPDDGSPLPDFPSAGDAVDDDLVDPVLEHQEGESVVTPDGYAYKYHEPDFPGEALSETNRTYKSEIAASLGQGYHTLSGDLTQVNFSSLRAGALAERDAWRQQQQLWISRRDQPRFEHWVALQLALGTLNLSRGLDYYLPHSWQPRTWEWVQPHQEVSAKGKEIELGLNSQTSIMIEQGRDPEKIRNEQLEQLRHELELAKLRQEIAQIEEKHADY